MASILKTDPDYVGLPQSIHPRFRDLLRRCLEKDPTHRFRDIGDVRYELQGIQADPYGVTERGPVEQAAERRPTLSSALATGFALATIVLGSLLVRDTEPGPTRLSGCRSRCQPANGSCKIQVWRSRTTEACWPMSVDVTEWITCVSIRWTRGRRVARQCPKAWSTRSSRRTPDGSVSSLSPAN